MRQLMVSSYAPYRDGIANYAVQEVAALRRDGHDVEVLSPLPSAAHHHLPLPSSRSMLELARRAGTYDRIVVQYHPDLFFSEWWGRGRRQAVWAAFGMIAERTELELRLHEIDYRSDPVRDAVRRFALRRAAHVVVHTDAERQKCLDAFGLPAAKVTVIDHGRSFEPRTTMNQTQARDELGLPANETVFVSIGFIQPHKGFDRAVRAFGRLAAPARLYVVGDTRIDDPEWVRYCDELEDLIAGTPGAEMRRGYVSDEQFDLWITAADRVVLPYREIWSSSVVERAALLGTPAIVTSVGGLAQQVGDGGVVVDDDDALAQAMAEVVGASLRPPAVETAAHDGVPTRSELQSAIDAARRIAPVPAASSTRRRGLASRRLGPAPRPAPTSAKPLNAALKKVSHRLAQWMVEPLATHVDHAVQALAGDVEALDERVRRLEGDDT